MRITLHQPAAHLLVLHFECHLTQTPFPCPSLSGKSTLTYAIGAKISTTVIYLHLRENRKRERVNAAEQASGIFM